MLMVKEGREEGGVRMYANAGKDVEMPTEDNARFVGQSVWVDGRGVFLSAGEVMAGEVVRVMVVAPEDAVVECDVFYQAKNVWEVGIGRTYLDYCRSEVPKIYKFTLPKFTN